MYICVCAYMHIYTHINISVCVCAHAHWQSKQPFSPDRAALCFIKSKR